MRLSPVLLAAVAIAVPLGGSLTANAETANSSKQTTEVLTLGTNQQPEKDTGQVDSSKSLESRPNPTEFIEAEKSPIVAISPANSAAIATPEVIAPTSITPKTAQILINPNPTQQPSPAPDIPPPEIQQPSAAPVIPPSDSQRQQIIPTPPPSATPSPQNVNPQTIPSPQNVNPQTIPSPQNVNPQTIPGNTQPNIAPEANDPRVLVSEVVVKSQAGQLSPELEDQVYKVIRTQPGRTTTRSQLQEDINAIFGTGFFSNVQAAPEDTPLGVRVSFIVQPNPILSKVQVQANPGTGVPSVLPAKTVDEIFREQYGKILNLRDLQEGIKQLNKRYQDQGYVLANVIGAPQVSDNGVVTLQIAEGVVENIRIRFRNKNGQDTDEKGQPIRGRTKDYIITRELELKPGQVFNRNTVQKDLQRVYRLGLFEDVNVSLDPGTDPSKVDVVVNVAERSSGSIAFGAGISSATGLFGTVSYQQQNLNGRDQKLGAEVQVGQQNLVLFDLRFTDPWIAGDPYRTSYTTDVFRRSSLSLIFQGKNQNILTFNPSDPTNQYSQNNVSILRLGGGITFSRPLSSDPLKTSAWSASAGLQYQRVSARDNDGNIVKEGAIFDSNGNRISQDVPLTLSDTGQDDLLLLQLGVQRDLRNNPLQPTSGSYLRLGVDQSVPLGLGNILMTRLRGSYSQYFPIKLISFPKKGAQTLAFNFQAGTILGDLPPYEAFTLGGSNSVRGYGEGQLGSGRTYVQASVEYRFPVFSVVSGALFFDYGSDLGSNTLAATVLNQNGNGDSGNGYGYGLGIRIQSPLGPIRIDYGINNEGGSQINFGIGERF